MCRKEKIERNEQKKEVRLWRCKRIYGMNIVDAKKKSEQRRARTIVATATQQPERITHKILMRFACVFVFFYTFSLSACNSFILHERLNWACKGMWNTYLQRNTIVQLFIRKCPFSKMLHLFFSSYIVCTSHAFSLNANTLWCRVFNICKFRCHLLLWTFSIRFVDNKTQQKRREWKNQIEK